MGKFLTMPKTLDTNNLSKRKRSIANFWYNTQHKCDNFLVKFRQHKRESCQFLVVIGCEILKLESTTVYMYILSVYICHWWHQFQAGWAGSRRLSTLSRLHCYLVFILKYNGNIFIWRRVQDKKIVFLKKKLDIQVLLKIIDTYT